MEMKFGTKWAVTRLIQEISPRALHLMWGFGGWAIGWNHSDFTTIVPCCHGNDNWDKMGYNSACTRDIFGIFV